MKSSPIGREHGVWRAAVTRGCLVMLTVFTAHCSSTAEPQPTTQDDGPDAVADGAPLDAPEETTGPTILDVVDEEVSATVHALTYHRNIKPILEARCVRCHTEGAIQANSALTSHAEVVKWADVIRHQVTNHLMPPWRAAEGCSEYRFDESMSQDEIDQVVAWIDDDAPEGDPAEPPVEVSPIEFANLDRVDLVIDMAAPYTPQEAPDEVRCFVLPWPEDELKYVTGFGTEPGVPGIVHHAAVWSVDPGLEGPYLAWDEEDEEPGYSCFGGPSGPDAGAWPMSGVRMISAWYAGLYGVNMPDGVGSAVLPGSHIILQVHYNVLYSAPEADQTALVFKLDDEVEHAAVIQPWTNFFWVLQGGMDIPAGEPQVTHSYAANPWALPPFIEAFEGDVGARLYTVALHMHLLAVSGRVTIERADGTTECLLHITDWSYTWQRAYTFQEPKNLYPGDRLAIECTFDNSAANQPIVNGVQQEPKGVAWGEDPTDEMCLGFFVTVPLDDAPPISE